MFQDCSRQTFAAFLIPEGASFARILVMVILASMSAGAQQNELRQIASSLAHGINSRNRHTVTVADFTDLQGNVTELGRFISEELSTQLVTEAKSFTVVERIQLAAILKEHQISISGLVDPATIRKLGQFAGVDAIVTGILVPFSDSVRLTARVLDISTAEVMAVSTADLPRTKAIDDLLSRGISAAGAQTGNIEGPPPSTQSSGARLGALPAPAITTYSGKGCRRSSDRIELTFAPKRCHQNRLVTSCSVELTNKGTEGIQLSVDQIESSLVDDSGNESRLETLSVGQRQEMHLEPEVPILVTATAEGVSSKANRMSLLLRFAVDYCPPLNVAIKNIAFER